MKKIPLLILISLGYVLHAQIAPDKYYIQFTDKEGTPYSIDNPSAFLSERSILRRQHQNIAISEEDLPVNPAYLDAVEATGASMLYPSKWLNGVTIETQSQQVLDEIASLPFVSGFRSLPQGLWREQPKPKQFFKVEETGDHLRPETTYLKQSSSYNYGSGYTQISQINGIPLHDDGFRGEGMVIALLDAGYVATNTHIAFDSIRNNGQILGTKDFVHPGGDVYTESSHGTSVLSTIASNVSGQLIGTAPKASFWLLRSEFVQYEHVIEEYNWVSAAEFADSVGADVINSSLGYIDFDYPIWDHSYSHMDGQTCIATIGADIAASKGILVVNSAGNSGNSNSFPYIGSPADGFKVFSIGAVTGNGDRASFSSIGPTYDGRIKPDVMAMGQGTAVATGSNSFSFSNGTSFSSPVMAGMAACLWQAKPGFTNLQIKDAIMQSGSYASDPDVYMGYGIPDMVVAYSLLTAIDTGHAFSEPLISIHPNPISEELKIVYRSFRQLLDLTLMDAQGRVIHQGRYAGWETATLRQQILRLPAGIYLIQASDGQVKQTTKIAKL